MNRKILNAGCGRDVREGWINLERVAGPGVDVVHDLERHPLPFADGEFDEVFCRDVLEHLDYLPLLGEFHRILKPGGALRVRVPHFTSVNNYLDPTHRHFFSARTLEAFVAGTPFSEGVPLEVRFARAVSRRITFARGLHVYNGIVERVVNADRRLQNLYEETFLCRLFPAENVEAVLEK